MAQLENSTVQLKLNSTTLIRHLFPRSTIGIRTGGRMASQMLVDKLHYYVSYSDNDFNHLVLYLYHTIDYHGI